MYSIFTHIYHKHPIGIPIGNKPYPIGSTYGMFTYIWLIFMVNVGKYIIHGSL